MFRLKHSLRAATFLFAANLLSACTFGPRDPEAPPDNSSDKIAEATAHEGSDKVDKDGFRTPDAKPVEEDDALTVEAFSETDKATDEPRSSADAEPLGEQKPASSTK